MLWTLLVCADPASPVDSGTADAGTCPPTCEEGEIVAQGDCRAIEPLYTEDALDLLGERSDGPWANGRYEVWSDQDALEAGWEELFSGVEDAGEPPEVDWEAHSVVLVAPGLVEVDQRFELAGVSVYGQTVNGYGLLHTGGEGCIEEQASATPAWVYLVPERGTTGGFYLDRWTCDCA